MKVWIAALFAALALLVLPGVAAAQNVNLPLADPTSQTVPPPGFAISARDAIAVAERTPAVREARRKYDGLRAHAYVWEGNRWEIDYYDSENTQVEVDISTTGEVLLVYTGLQSRSYFTRGGFAGQLGSPWLFLAFSVLFLVPFVDRRRTRRLLHLDLLVLLGFGIPFALLSAGRVTSAVWTLYPLFGYLLVRGVQIGRGRGRSSGRLVPALPTAALLVGLLLLVGGRVALNVTSDQVMDIGYASVVGADRIMHGDPLYTDNDGHGDTYGAFNYVAYVPFEAVFPTHGVWDSVPAAHAASIAFDLLTILGLFVLGSQMRAGPEGRRLGLALGWAWAAYPLTLFNLVSNTNDGLVALLVVWSLVAFNRPGARGAILGLAAATKFFPGALLGALWRGRDARPRREMVLTAAACVGMFALVTAIYLPHGGLRVLWNCTLGFQLERPADYSLWGLYPGLHTIGVVLEVLAIGFAIVVGFLPRGRRTVVEVAGLMTAVTVAVQIGAGHWFFFYVVWFAPTALVALLGTAADRESAATPERIAEPALVAA